MHRTANQLVTAVWGASGIGRIHVREFTRAGARVAGILGSTADSTARTTRCLNQEFGLNMVPFPDPQTMLAHGIQAVSICTPWDLHYDQILWCLKNGLYVFCEKPLFWNEGDSTSEFERKCFHLLEQGGTRLGVNTANATLWDIIRKNFALTVPFNIFSFDFITNGAHSHGAIGIDLLPHGLSIAQAFGLNGTPKNIRNSIEKTHFRTHFFLGDTECNFHFSQDPSGEKILRLGFNDRYFIRESDTSNGTFNAYIKECGTENRIQYQDPFTVYISDFVSRASIGSNFLADAERAIENLKWMNTILRSKL
ncbi:MAG: Gfo/Idh/MocA family oxidoreductase [Gammaproteobacteria bacterium]|nr:Gfo/Idh/MocA family oxidoreductase [Gammaproteobacteria bacterium]